jgi:hypothetical protein
MSRATLFVSAVLVAVSHAASLEELVKSSLSQKVAVADNEAVGGGKCLYINKNM